LAALALAAFAAAPASAAAPSAAAGAPLATVFGLSAVGSVGSIHLRGTPGRVLHGAVRVRNLSRRPIVVILQRANLANAGNGNAEFLTTGISGTGGWLRLSAGKVSLAPLASRVIAYTVSIPAGTTGASHYAGIVAVNAADLITPATRRKSKAHTVTVYRVSRQALPLTIRLPGPLTRSLSLTSLKLTVAPAGASLVLGLAPGGTELTEGAQVNLRVLRGTRTIFASTAGLGQLFPVGSLNYHIAWPGRPTTGAYQVVGTIRPQGSPVININRTIAFTAANATQLKREAPPVAQAPAQPSGTPGWVWIALGLGAAFLITLSIAVWKLARRPRVALT
jgi:hypothetical protein